MNAIDAIKTRYSCRKYEEKAVPEEILKDLVDCARLAPSGYNRQGWVFVVVTDKKVKDEMVNAATSGKFMEQAGAAIAVFCDKTAPCMMEDACAATENIIIAANSYGLGTCWINSYQKPHSEELKAILNCPDTHELVTLTAVGYPAVGMGQRDKKSVDEVIKWNGFDAE